MATARQKINDYINRPCFYLEPFGLALAFNKIDPETGLPGIPLGTVWEIAGSNGRGKTLTAERKLVHVHKRSKKKSIWLGYEPVNMSRLIHLEHQGLDLDKLEILDYSKSPEGYELEFGEQGLNTLMSMAETGDFVDVIVDSIGSMATRREVFDNKGEYLGVDKTPQLAIRATILTRFINQWLTMDPNQRPILTLINHMKEVVDVGGFGLDPLKVTRIGENLNYNTPGGNGIKFACDLRVKLDARKIELRGGDNKTIKHPVFENPIQTGLEIQYEVFKNKFCGETGSRRAIGKFDFASGAFDTENEVISYCDYLDLSGINNSGGFVSGLIPNKKVRMKEAVAFLRDNPQILEKLMIQIAARSNELFSFKDKKKPVKEGL